MAFMMEKILGNAQKLSNRLKEHNGSTDNLVELMSTLNKKIDSMRTFQDNLPDLTEMALRKPRCTVKLGLSQENSQIRELEQENKELKQSLDEHELALDLIMSKYRQQMTRLLGLNRVNESILQKETAQTQELQDKAEKINEMGKVMWEAIGDDDQSTYDSQQLLTQLRIENNGIRELLFIACNSGNPLKVVNQRTQTDSVIYSPRRSDQAMGLSLPSDSNKGDTAVEFLGASVGATSRKLRPDYLNSEVLGHGNDTCLALAVKSPREFRNEKASFELSSDSFTSQNRDTRAVSEIDRPSFSNTRPALSSLPVPVRGEERVESALDDVVLPDVVTSLGHSVEQMPNEDQGIFDAELFPSSVVNHACENETPNCLDEPNYLQIDGNLPSASADAFSATSNRNSADAERTLQVSSSSAAGTLSARSPKLPVAVNEIPASPKVTAGNKNITAATSSGNRGSPKTSSSPSHGAVQKNVSTPPTGGTPSRLKHGGTAISTSPHLKTPAGKISTVNETASSVTASAASKNSPFASPSSIHSGKTATTGQAARTTPIRIKTTAKQPSVFSVLGVASAANLRSNITTPLPAIAPVVLDSNGNNSRSPVQSEMSNVNKTSPDVSVDGQ